MNYHAFVIFEIAEKFEIVVGGALRVKSRLSYQFKHMFCVVKRFPTH